jgi:FMN phosphatase YigB (HAD superfamily)
VPNQHKLVVLFDVDNTLLDNDRFGDDLTAELESLFDADQRARYRKFYEQIRDERGYADYLGALQLFRSGLDDDPRLLEMSSFMLEYPFAERVFPGALEVIAHVRSFATTAVLSDGDVVFQPRKVQHSGIWDAMDGNVMIYVH